MPSTAIMRRRADPGQPVAWSFPQADFPPSRLRLLVLDITTILLQALALVITYERAHYGEDASFNDSSSSEADSSGDEEAVAAGDQGQSQAPGSASPILTGISANFPYFSPPHETPLINLKLRHTMHRIMHDKPISIIGGDDPGSATSSDPTTLARLRRIHARIRQRRRNLGQSADATETDRLEEGSDEEREVGMLSSRDTPHQRPASPAASASAS